MTSAARLIILGSSAGRASAHRAASSYLLDLGSHGVLIDCGDGATRNFLRAGFLPEWVEKIVITHTHADHVAGVPYFLQQRYLVGTDRPLTVHCPEDAIGPLKDVLDFSHLFAERMPFPLYFESLLAGRSLDCDGARVTPYPTTHLEGNSAWRENHGFLGNNECFAVRIEINGRVIVYSSDLGALADLDMIPLPIDWLLVETSHIALDELWPWVEERRVKRVILTHLSDDFDVAAVASARPGTKAEILLAEDGMTLDLRDGAVTRWTA